MSPSLVSELRDLHHSVRMSVTRIAVFLASIALASAIILLLAAGTAAIKEEQVYAVTMSGYVFALQPQSPQRAEQLLSTPAGSQALEIARRGR